MTVTGADVLTAAAVIMVVGGASGLLWKFFGSPIFHVIGRTNHFLDDWFGVPDRDGVPGRKGVMVRLATVEEDKVDRAEFIVLANEVALKASSSELYEMRLALEAHISRTSERLHLVEEEEPPA